MKLDDFVLDAASNVYVSKTHSGSFDYLDGAERYLRDVFLSAQDLGLLSPELKSKVRDWPSLYHLSPYRATVLDCFDFRDRGTKVLELGAGCGSITRWLGEHFNEVHSVEGSIQRASVARLRCRDLDNVKVYASNFYDLAIDKEFDLITLIGVLEYGNMYHPVHKNKPCEAALSTLKFIHDAIRDNGVLILAIENKLGLKYFSGAKEDHSGKIFDGIQGYSNKGLPVTFSAAELSDLLLKAGFTSADFFLPFPDYKLARTIINAQMLASHHHYLYNWIETPFPDRVDGQRVLLFNESLALREITKAGLLRDLANSFLVVAHKGEKDVNADRFGYSDKRWAARHYTMERHKAFCKRVTLFLPAIGPPYVEGEPVFSVQPESVSPASVFSQKLSPEPFQSGELLAFRIFEMIASGTFDSSFEGLLEKFHAFLIEQYSSGKHDEDGISLLKGEALDVTIWNIIEDEQDKRWTVIDREWSFSGLIPADFILWRNLYHMFLRYNDYFGRFDRTASPDERTIFRLKKIYPSISQERVNRSRRFDQAFQDFVNHGTVRDDALSITGQIREKPAIKIKDLPGKSSPLVSIIVPAYNNLDLTRQCLNAVRQTTDDISYEIIIVDNASSDGTSDYLSEEQTAGRIKAIVNKENLGFAKACNQGARAATGKYLLFLNNDTIPQAGWLEEMVSLAESDDSIGIVGSKMIFPDGTIQHAGVVVSASKLPYHIYRGLPADAPCVNKQRDYQIVTAACLLIKKDLFTAVGGFDERYINGCEDIDLCLKIREKNKRVVYNPKSVLIHLEGKSEGRQDRMDYNRRLFLRIWGNKIRQDDLYLLERDGMELVIDPEGSYLFVPKEKDALPKVSIVIVTFNSASIIRDCLKSILLNTRDAEIIVVDNASTDETRNILNEYGERLSSVIFNEENKGFSFACNQGVRISKGRHIILLNPDTVVTPLWAERLIAHFKPRVGAVGPLSNYVAALQKFVMYCREPVPEDINIDDLSEKLYDWNHGQGTRTKLLVGFCIAFPRSVLDEVGLLDENLVLGNDDLDISWRLRQRGYKLIIATDTFVYHKGQVSFKSKSEESVKLLEESNRRFYEKLKAHYGDGNIPLPRELWGVDFFNPPGANFRTFQPTFAALYIVHNETTWLRDSFESVYTECDAIYFLVSEKPWFGEITNNSSTLDFIRALPDPDNKIRIERGSWQIEADKRNRGMELIREAGFTFAFIIDTDEIYDPVELRRMKAFAADHSEVDCWHMSMHTYWKSYRYRIDPPEPLKPPVFAKADTTYFTHIRDIDADSRGFIPPEIGICHHMSYAISDEAVHRKITLGSHAPEVQPGWFENIWQKWDADHSMTNLHPTHPHCYQKAIEQPYAILPPVLKKRYLADMKDGGTITGMTSIIILAHNQWDQTELCLKSIAKNTPGPHEIIVIDNGSTDETPVKLKEMLETLPALKVIINSSNRGFAGGNNQGMSIAKGEYVLLLNNDTVVTKGWLKGMLDVCDRHPKTALVGPMSNYVSGPQLVKDVDYKSLDRLEEFSAKWTKEHEAQSIPVPRLVGFCLLMKREVSDIIGGLDERFGSGNFEDDDFCIRAGLYGYELRVARDVFIHHTGGQTFREANIDYRESLLKNWQIFKEKWGIPKYLPYEKGYPVLLLPPPGLSAFIPLPDISADHRSGHGDRWWHDLTEKQEVKSRKQGLTSIVLLVSNREDRTKRCIKGIRKHTREPHEIIFVLLNASQSPVKWIRKQIKENPHYKLIESAGNLNYSQACNKGIKEASGEYILIMEDATVVTEDWLSGLQECLNSDTETAVAGPLTNNGQGIQGSVKTDYASPDYLDRFARDFMERNRYRRIPVKQLSCFCLLLRHSFIEKTGLFDERFDSPEFAVSDICFRAVVEGFHNTVAGDVFVHHVMDETNRNYKDRPLFLGKWDTGRLTDVEKQKATAAHSLMTAREHSLKGQQNEAASVLVEGLEQTPYDMRLHYALIEILMEKKQFTDCLNILEKLPEEKKLNEKELELTGYCKEGLGLDNEAGEYAEVLLSLNNRSSKALDLRGLLSYKKGAYADAEKYFRQSIEADMSSGEAYASLGALLWNANKPDEAYRLFEKAFILSPQSQEIAENYYAAAVSLQKLQEAESLLKDAVSLNPLHRKLRLMLVDCLLQQEKFDGAMQQVEVLMENIGIDDDILELALRIRDKVGTGNLDEKALDTVSLCMIVKDEEKNIVPSLMSMKPVVDEVIIVDTGSKDKTRDIAKALGAKVFDFPWNGNFSDARNFSLSKASGKWILVLDADEVISSADHKALRKLIKDSPLEKGVQGVVCSPLVKGYKGGCKSYHDEKSNKQPPAPPLLRGNKDTAYSFVTRNYILQANSAGWTANDGMYMEEAGSGWAPSEKVRLFPNDLQIRFQDPVHELVEPSIIAAGIPIKKCTVPVHHYGRLDSEKLRQKGEDYLDLGRKKISAAGTPDADALYELAVQADELGKHDEALEYWKRLAGLLPDSSRVCHGLGNNLFQTGRYKDALEASGKAFKLSPDSKNTVVLYAKCEICAGDVSTAIGVLEELLKKDPSHPAAIGMLAAAYFAAGQNEKGFEYIQKLYAVKADASGLFAGIAKALISGKRIKQAVTLLEGAREGKQWNDDMSNILEECKKEGPLDQEVKDSREKYKEAPWNPGTLESSNPVALDPRTPDSSNPVALDLGTLESPDPVLLSLCMIVKNEEKSLGCCLESIKPMVDELIIVDTGSTDKTKEIAESYGAKVFDFPWNDNFSDARNFSLSKATGKWIFVLDADEVIAPSDLEALRNLIEYSPLAKGDKGGCKSYNDEKSNKQPPAPPLLRGNMEESSTKAAAYRFVTRNYVDQPCSGWTANDGKYMEEAGTGWFPSEKVRLFPNDNRIHFENPVHEFVESSLSKLGTEIRQSIIPVHHYGKLDPDRAALRSDAYYTLGKKKLTGRGESDENSLFEMAVQAAELKKYEEAIEYWHKLLRTNPVSQKALHGLGNAFYNLGKYEDAIKSYQKALRINPDGTETAIMLAICEVCAGRADVSVSLLEDLLTRNIDHPFALLTLTAAYFCTGEKDKGTDAMRRLNDRRIDFSAFFTDFAKRSMDAKRYFFAVSLLEALVENGYTTNEISKLLAECNELQKDSGIQGGKGPREEAKENSSNPVALDPRTLGPSDPVLLSLCMIVKNEEKNLGRCLESVKPIVDEIIVVDTGSTDRTKEIARPFGAKVFDFPWNNNFSDARNFSLSKATGKWILVLDADEVISASDHEALRKLVEYSPLEKGEKGGCKSYNYEKSNKQPPAPPLLRGNKDNIAYSFVTRNYVASVRTGWIANDGKYGEEAGTGWISSDKVRLFRNDSRTRFENPVHELVEPSLKRAGIEISNSGIPIHHYGYLDNGKNTGKGKEYYNLGKKKLAEKGGQDVKALFELAVQAGKLEKYDEALGYWKKIIDIGPDNAMAQHNIGTVFLALARYNEALSAFRKALNLDPSLTDTIVLYATCEICTGDADVAIKHLEKLLKKDGKFLLALFTLTAAYFCIGRKDKGTKYLKKLEDQKNDYLGYLINFGKILISAGRPDYAAALLEALQEHSGGNSEIRRLLALCNT